MDVRNNVALITGGARGMGKAYAKAILENGGKVSIVDVLVKEGEATHHEFNEQFGAASSKFIECDVTNSEEFENAFRETKEYFGRLDIVVNNAGVLKVDHKFDSLTIDINLKALIKGTYLALDHLRKDRGGQGGTIVNIGSVASLFPMNNEASAVYAASKYGVLGFTQCVALSIGEPSTSGHGVKLVCLCPSPIATLMMLEAMEADSAMDTLAREMGFNEESTVVAAFMKLLCDSNNHGGVLKVTKQDGIVYVFPKHLRQEES